MVGAVIHILWRSAAPKNTIAQCAVKTQNKPQTLPYRIELRHEINETGKGMGHFSPVYKRGTGVQGDGELAPMKDFGTSKLGSANTLPQDLWRESRRPMHEET